MKTAAIFLFVFLALGAQMTAQNPGAAQGHVRHLVYRFGYNTKVADAGTGTGSTTIDITGPAKDGGMTVHATDEWWNTVRPRQTSVCEVYPNGGVTCAQAPYAISPIQIVIVPLLARDYFTPLSAGINSSWQRSYEVRATFLPGAHGGFAGRVTTWNCEYTLEGKGHVPQHAPLVLVESDGKMKQQGGRFVTANQKARIVIDPQLKIPAIVAEEIRFTPQMSVSRYTVDFKLIKSE